jgi:mannose-6-phosphate isomerase-like protein (cupin superfamily)
MDYKGQKLDISSMFTVLKPDQDAVACAKTPTLYAELDKHFNNFIGHYLVSSYNFDTDWSEWEMHPKGDEIVILLSGEVKMIMETGAGRETVNLNDQGSYIIVPRGTWHTAHTTVATTMLFITPGEGTEGRSA